MPNPGIRTRFPSRDLTGEIFSRWKVSGLGSPNKRNQTRWRCICQCGTIKDVETHSLLCGDSGSCGCLKRENTSKTKKTHGATTRGQRIPEYGIWATMINRCYRKNTKGYKLYGARGIRVCDRWRHYFAVFYEDMGPRAGSEYSLDRIDNDGDYEPTNCRWATKKQQANNRRTNRMVVFNKESMTLQQASERYGIHPYTIYRRLQAGWTTERALTEPIHPR